MIGQTVGKYRIVSRLGRGGMGTVYKAVDETLDREVAIKILNPDLADDEVLKRFRAEAVTLARLNHPNIATLYELAQHGDDLLMVMEFVNGETFDHLSDRLGPLPFDRAGMLCSQVLDALGHAHRAGIVHRDLKPANLMIAESGIVKVMDFGIARMVGTEHITTDGYMMGTPAYMAPEQVMGDEADGRADLYAIGVVLYRLLTANLPFKADTAIAMVQKQIKDPPTPLWQFTRELPEWCQGILDRALAKAPHERYQTAEEFRAALLAAASSAGAQADTVNGAAAVRTTPPERSTRAAAGHRPAAAALAATGILAAAGWMVTRQASMRSAARESVAAPVALSGVTTTAPPGTPPTAASERPTAAAEKAVAVKSPLSAASPAVPATSFPPVVVQSIGVLIVEGGKSRERDASLRLADGSVQVVERNRPVKRAPYGAIVAVFHSRSKEPCWVTPNGAIVPVARVDRGRLRFFGGKRDWLTVQTKSEFIAMRTEPSDVSTIIAALEARTGLKVIRAAVKD